MDALHGREQTSVPLEIGIVEAQSRGFLRVQMIVEADPEGDEAVPVRQLKCPIVILDGIPCIIPCHRTGACPHALVGPARTPPKLMHFNAGPLARRRCS